MTDYQRDPESRGRFWGASLAALALVGVVALFVWAGRAVQARSDDVAMLGKALGPEGCISPENGRDPHSNASQFVILVDVTDPLPPLVRKAARDRIAQELRAARELDRAMLYQVQGLGAAAKQITRACKPPDLRASWRLFDKADPYKDKRDTLDRFRGAADVVMASEKGSEPSPILEAMAVISRDAAFSKSARTRTLIVVSDLYQNSEWFNIYAGPISASDVQAQDAWGRFPDLSGVRVIVLQPEERGANMNGVIADRARLFWTVAFRRAGADAQIVPISSD